MYIFSYLKKKKNQKNRIENIKVNDQSSATLKT